MQVPSIPNFRLSRPEVSLSIHDKASGLSPQITLLKIYNRPSMEHGRVTFSVYRYPINSPIQLTRPFRIVMLLQVCKLLEGGPETFNKFKETSVV